MTGMSMTGRRSAQRAERRRLAHQDRVSARLAELGTIQTILTDAQEVLGAGWAQGTWATYDGVCLVTSIRDAGGGGQRTARALDLVWHCLLYTSPSPRDLSTSRMPSSA